MENSSVFNFSILILLFYICLAQATVHVDDCDNFCGGSKLNVFGKSGSCKSCCLEKGYTNGGSCGDALYRHCRCVQNVGQPMTVIGHPPVQQYSYGYPQMAGYAGQAYPPAGFVATG